MGPNLSVLLAILPGRGPPKEEDASPRLSPFYGFVAGPDDGGEGARWTQGWRSPEGDEHLLSLGAFESGWVDVPLCIARLPKRVTKAVRAARWALWCTTRLDPGDPLSAFARQMRFASIAAPEAVAVHDHASQRVFSAEHLRAVASWATPPPPTELYSVHAVAPPKREGTAWVHTHGLERCGMPDVDVLRVPTHLLEPASNLVSAFVRSRLGTTVPARGFTDDLVLGHRVAWLPVKEAAIRVPEGDLGGTADRRIAPSHGGHRIALVADTRPDRPPDPPVDVLRAFEDASAIVRVRPSEAERAARLARERWPVFETLFASHGRELEWSFVVCVPLETASGGKESLWWVVEDIRDGRVRAQVRNEVVAVAGLETGDVRWHDVSALEDWVVYAPRRDITPATVSVPP